MFPGAHFRQHTNNKASSNRINNKEGVNKSTKRSTPNVSGQKSIKQKPTDTDYRYTVYFDDGIRKIDAVLVYNANEPSMHRETFIYNIRKQKLQIEVTPSLLPTKKERMFVKIHAPDDLLWKYIKIFGFQMKCEKQFFLPENTVFSNCTETILTDTKPSRLHPDANRAWTTISKELPDTFTSAERSMIVFSIMQYIHFGKTSEPFKIGLEYLLMKNDFIAAFPMHDGEYTWPKNDMEPLNDRQLLAKYWADFSTWNKEQPLYHVEDYFGSEIAMFFAWIGFYNKMLILASIVGVLTFVGGFYRIYSSIMHIKAGCRSPLWLCPICKLCEPIQVKYYCANYYMSFVIDGPLSMFYAFFITIWEFWKREKNILDLKWNINCNVDHNYRPEFQATVRTTRIRPYTQEVELYIPTITKFWSLCISYVIVFVMSKKIGASSLWPKYSMIKSTLIANENLDISRFSKVVAFLKKQSIGHESKQSKTLTREEIYRFMKEACTDKFLLAKIILALISTFGVIVYEMYMKILRIQPIFITLSASTITQLIMNGFKWVYGHLAHYLTNKENPRTQQDFDKSYMLKIIMFAAVNNYGKILYIAFLKGNFYTHPGLDRIDSLGLAAESCDPPSCVVDMFIFLAVNSICSPFHHFLRSYFLPIIKIWCKRLKEKRFRNIDLPSWEENFELNATDHSSIMDDIEQMGKLLSSDL